MPSQGSRGCKLGSSSISVALDDVQFVDVPHVIRHLVLAPKRPFSFAVTPGILAVVAVLQMSVMDKLNMSLKISLSCEAASLIKAEELKRARVEVSRHA